MKFDFGPPATVFSSSDLQQIPQLEKLFIKPKTASVKNVDFSHQRLDFRGVCMRSRKSGIINKINWESVANEKWILLLCKWLAQCICSYQRTRMLLICSKQFNVKVNPQIAKDYCLSIWSFLGHGDWQYWIELKQNANFIEKKAVVSRKFYRLLFQKKFHGC